MRFRMSFVALVAVVSALAAVLIPASAEAAPLRVWKRLAQCESGQRWHINTGNGYYGGLQFSASTWAAFGGHRFAQYAHHATRAEQIRIAERVRAAQGWGAWPACSAQIGLL